MLRAKSIALVPLRCNPVDDIWVDRPSPSKELLRFHPVELAGEAVADKLERVRANLRAAGVNAVVLSKLDEVALLSVLVCIHIISFVW